MAKIKILVVEDESLVAKDIHNMLKSLGYEVVDVLATGEEAVLRAEELSPDLVLMDIVLKGEIDGIVAAEQIWENFLIPVIYLTAYADEMTLQRAKLTEPFGYILKPFDERELQTTIEMAFYKAKMDKRLREREEWLSTILKSIGDGVIAADNKGRVTFMNSLAEKLTGWKQTEALKKPLREVFQIQGETEDWMNDNPHPVHENILITKNSAKLSIEETVSPIRSGKKETIGNVLIFRDITQRKLSEVELKLSWERLQKALAGTVQAMAMTIERRDPYTAGHQRRVSKLSSAIAAEMSLPPEKIEGIRMAGDIHDIGKIYVPAEILSKPGQLTEIENSIIRTHSQVGYDILNSIEFPWPIAQIIYQHHERINGSGYPNKLKGDEILLEARIISVADVVEAMSSHRPYRPSYGIDKALNEIIKNRGLLYDAGIVDVCVRLFKEKKFTFE
jgi:PAS domain S-box-containing protein/putative nucleotidyltransferase with HDIG domain